MNVLLVDDEPMSRLILKRLLSRLSRVTVVEAADGEQAWALVEETRPAAVLCDISMPKVDGVTFLRRLRADARFKALPVVMISATKDRDQVLELAGLQISDYILKPFELAKTFQRLERLLLPLLAAAAKTPPIAAAPAPGPTVPATSEAAPAEAAPAEAAASPPSQG